MIDEPDEEIPVPTTKQESEIRLQLRRLITMIFATA